MSKLGMAKRQFAEAEYELSASVLSVMHADSPALVVAAGCGWPSFRAPWDIVGPPVNKAFECRKIKARTGTLPSGPFVFSSPFSDSSRRTCEVGRYFRTCRRTDYNGKA